MARKTILPILFHNWHSYFPAWHSISSCIEAYPEGMDDLGHSDGLVYDQGYTDRFVLSDNYTARFTGTNMWQGFFEPKNKQTGTKLLDYPKYNQTQ